MERKLKLELALAIFVLSSKRSFAIVVSKRMNLQNSLAFVLNVLVHTGKTSHQAISHRVKSITMSNWTLEEVLELTDQKGGGNNAALHVWLQKSPPIGQR